MATVKISRLTNAQKSKPNSGTGIFDELMEQVNNHIEHQFDKGRLTGPDFAQVYLGSIQSTIAEAIKFLLQEQESDLRAELLEAQVQTELLNQTALQAQITAQAAKNVLERDLLEQNINIAMAEAEAKESQTAVFKKESPLKLELLEQQIAAQAAANKMTKVQTEAATAEAPITAAA